MDKFQLKITTPDRTLFEGEVYEALVPTPEGEIGILPNHKPLISLVSAGPITLKKSIGDEGEHISTSGGFVKIDGNTVMLLADSAEFADEIDEQRTIEAKKLAEKRKLESKDEVEFTEASAALEQAIARLKVLDRKHKRSHH